MWWTKGSVKVNWTEKDFKQLPFEVEDISDSEKKPHRAQGYTHDQYSGDVCRCIGWKPNWVDSLSEQIGLTNCGYNFYRMKQLDIRPEHTDHFKNYAKIYSVEKEDVHRAVVFLEDWKIRHYFDINGYGIVNWKAGDYVLWRAAVPHSASNIGQEMRYTLQITGVRVD